MRVKDLPTRERPRERLMTSGPAALADRELLAVLLGSGFRGASAVDLASQVIEHCGDLDGLARSEPHRLLAVKGVGPAKAARVAAAFHLVRRAQADPERPRITSTSDLAAVAAPLLQGLSRERLVVVVCDPRGAVLRRTVLTEGGADHTAVPVREIVTTVLTSGGAAFGVAHNHPSGSLDPSDDDVSATARLAAAASTVGLRFLDHLIITDAAWRRVAVPEATPPVPAPRQAPKARLPKAATPHP
ncbi:DNA repair protein RadC [Nonomuraea sp. SMC257]|uniref:DNA repair protein RadC n=1 Tax=Nonomuraea montanisoli TaxID=2741721 RepID=A0A7Y6IEN6_9ACTN|nr:DNA repair protein RadC [Nonomuraea montanisoli]NUW36897.1 DNA repair protein RadC [Nonomuraea montanisoli]